MFSELFELYVNEFSNHGEQALKAICNCGVPSKVVLGRYKKLPPIELLPEEEKKELKMFVIQEFSNKTIAEKLDCCKIVYTIGILL